jgi:hypothetical protein
MDHLDLAYTASKILGTVSVSLPITQGDRILNFSNNNKDCIGLRHKGLF